MESVLVELLTEGSISAATHAFSRLRRVQVSVPAIFEKPIRGGDYPTNPQANRGGLPSILNNYSNHGAIISFFQFRSIQKLKSGQETYEYPVRFNLRSHYILEPKRMAQFLLPWKPVETASALAHFRRTDHPGALFRFELTAFDEFRNEFYHSGPLNESVIRSESSRMLGEY